MTLSDSPAPGLHDVTPFPAPAAQQLAGTDHDELHARFLRAGREAVDDRELLQLLLAGSHSAADASQLAGVLLDTFGSPARALAARPDTLRAVAGLGEAGIAAIKTAEALGIAMARAALPEIIHPQLATYEKVVEYAGIRSRTTPPSVLEAMTTMAAWLARRGWHLHSGGAAGADSAFAAGAPAERRTVFLPWPGYHGCQGSDCRTLSPESVRTCLAFAASLHPAWHRCSPAARKLHARNAAILIGEDADRPVHAVVAWTSRGLISGGTGQGIRIAHRYGIPVLNLGAMHPRAVCERLEEIRAAASPALPSG